MTFEFSTSEIMKRRLSLILSMFFTIFFSIFTSLSILGIYNWGIVPFSVCFGIGLFGSILSFTDMRAHQEESYNIRKGFERDIKIFFENRIGITKEEYDSLCDHVWEELHN